MPKKHKEHAVTPSMNHLFRVNQTSEKLSEAYT